MRGSPRLDIVTRVAERMKDNGLNGRLGKNCHERSIVMGCFCSEDRPSKRRSTAMSRNPYNPPKTLADEALCREQGSGGKLARSSPSPMKPSCSSALYLAG